MVYSQYHKGKIKYACAGKLNCANRIQEITGIDIRYGSFINIMRP